ncbi:superoxide dismutase [Blastocystis sp. subtype 4]|uniref:superoxide dismutase n=1 Tax=Blastocystis sp. subtype 4 TaxID=944170 RepID=UPI000711EEEC|nr:superoxide dismutase [Blastocystis sp. subtype 4]KNB44410.1 superoxide dismutase [Blastocystis sp. subtype 4]|eukprot:XP_014527853.1 superoxide dismutase [Blastocystis sp. subtype 4]
MAKVISYIQGDGIYGTVTFSQASAFATTIIDANIKGLPQGKHGISINVFGDLSNGFQRLGPHYNPMGKQHGPPDSDDRHVGSLGNIESDGSDAKLHLEDTHVQVIGPYSVIGRSVVIYEKEDDLGKGTTKQSHINGNVGYPIAAGVIGIACNL